MSNESTSANHFKKLEKMCHIRVGGKRGIQTNNCNKIVMGGIGGTSIK